MYNKILGIVLLTSSLGAVLVSAGFYAGVISQSVYDSVLAVDPFILLFAAMLGGLRLIKTKPAHNP